MRAPAFCGVFSDSLVGLAFLVANIKPVCLTVRTLDLERKMETQRHREVVEKLEFRPILKRFFQQDFKFPPLQQCLHHIVGGEGKY